MTQYKNKKPRTVNFYHIEGKDETLKKLDDKISTTYNLLKTHHSDQIETIEMGDNKYYIYSIFWKKHIISITTIVFVILFRS